ncbi:hypothetical protein ACJX0J_033066, partial [Zea mays]
KREQDPCESGSALALAYILLSATWDIRVAMFQKGSSKPKLGSPDPLDADDWLNWIDEDQEGVPHFIEGLNGSLQDRIAALI